MPHIHTDAGHHDLTACAFIVRMEGDEPKILLHAHKKLKKLLQIGGHVELDETPWQSVSHEILEESGYDMAQLQILQPKERIKYLSGATLHPQPVCINTHVFKDIGHYHTDIAYAFVTSELPGGAVADGESSELIWVSAAQLRVMSDQEVVENVREIGLYILETCIKSWQPVSVSEFQ